MPRTLRRCIYITPLLVLVSLFGGKHSVSHFLLRSVSAANTFIVTNTNDSGAGSLRQAILDANANPGSDQITFNIGSGLQTITLTANLPDISGPVVIDATTQPGFAGTPIIELSGVNIPTQVSRATLFLTAGNTTVRGLIINHFKNGAIFILTAGGNHIEGCYIGTDPTGNLSTNSQGNGISINDVSNNVIGGTTASARNLISGTNSHGISIFGFNGNGNVVQGNYIGTNAAGNAALGAFFGIFLGTSNNIVGGTVPGARNVISGTDSGIVLQVGGTSGNLIQGNYIGTDASGNVKIGNTNYGIAIFNSSNNNTIGGTSAGARNVVSGNGWGISIASSSDSPSGNVVQGNYIGLAADGSPLGNREEGLRLAGALNTTVGGISPGAANTIAFNGPSAVVGSGTGVDVLVGDGNSIRGNSIFSNNRLGIDLGNDGVTPNDPGDGDTGGNKRQNFPLITAVTSDGFQTSISGTLNSTPNTTFAVDFYTNSVCDPSGNGEGGRFFDATTVNTDGNGNAAINVMFPTGLAPGKLIAATATDPLGNTSEFSPCSPGQAAGSVQFSAASYSVIEDVVNATIIVVRTGGSLGSLTVDYSTANSTAIAGQDYIATSGTLTFNDGETSKSFDVPINDDGVSEPDENFFVRLHNASTVDSLGIPFEESVTIQDHDTVPTLSINPVSVNENAGKAVLAVSLSAATGRSVSVNYATSDLAGAQNCNVANGRASSRCDYISALGTLTFAARETSKTITVLIVNDSYAEGSETFTVRISGASGALIQPPSSVTVTINDNDSVNGPNPIDVSSFFVRQHYLDFLNREPDTSGLNFWTGEIENCTPKPQCTEIKRINVSAAFYLSIEFQETGYLVERIYKASYGEATGTSTLGGTHQLAVPIVRLNEFLPDTQMIGQGIVVGQLGWEQALETNKQAFTAAFVQRARFTTAYPTTLSPSQFVDMLFANAGVTPSATDRNAAINEFGGTGNTADTAARGRALRRVAKNSILNQQEKNQAFVLMQFFGYLRRNPNDPQDSDYTGYDFWLSKLNQFNGNFVSAEMVKAFLLSDEYRHRFGQ
jgi:hypothetical protein